MSALWEEIAAFIRSERDDDSVFEELAKKLFACQFAENLPYRRLCKARGATPDSVSNWREIPAAPASAFKRFALSCAPEENCAAERGGRIFHSSGTTRAETSRHFMDADALDLYRLALSSGYRRAIGVSPWGIAAVAPPPEVAPNSSLSFMLDVLIRERGMQFFDGPNLVNDLSNELRCTPYPYAIFGTAFALMNFFDATEGERYELPEGAVLVETGGFKGRSREVSREELYGLFCERLGVPDERCFSEYGMSELASQFYSVGTDGRKFGPPWVRTRTIDPATGTDALPGEPGLLCHYDLANENSVLAVQTEDLGILHPDGGFDLLGRAPGAVLRGCSLLSEAFFSD